MPREWSAWLERVAACAAALLTSGDTQVVQASIPTPFLYPPSHIGKCIRTGATVHGGRTQSYIESQIRVSGIRSETSPPTRESEMIKCALLHALEYMPYLDADTGGGATHAAGHATRAARAARRHSDQSVLRVLWCGGHFCASIIDLRAFLRNVGFSTHRSMDNA